MAAVAGMDRSSRGTTGDASRRLGRLSGPGQTRVRCEHRHADIRRLVPSCLVWFGSGIGRDDNSLITLATQIVALLVKSCLDAPGEARIGECHAFVTPGALVGNSSESLSGGTGARHDRS